MIDLTVTATRSHLPHAATMLWSLCTVTPRPLRVHLLHGGDVRPRDLAPLEASLSPFEVVVRSVCVPDDLVARLPDRRFHVSAWFRVLLPELAPGLDRALHVDVDTVVIRDVRPLWETDLSDALFAAAMNPLYPFQPPHFRTTLGLDSIHEYPNSGVMVMDLHRMRQEGLVAQILDYAARHPDNNWPEQDALAALCRGRWLELHPRWNVQTTMYDLDAEDLPYSSERLAEALADPAIVHFIGPYKPWTHACQHPLRHLYHHARSHTAYPPANRPATRRQRRMRRLREHDRARLALLEARMRRMLRTVRKPWR